MIYSPSNNYILFKQIDVLFKASLSGGLLNILGVCLVYFLVRDTEQQPAALMLCISVIFFAIIRTIVANNYLNKRSYRTRVYLVGYSLLTLLIGMSWGLFQYTQLFYNDIEIRNVIFLINFGLIGGSIAVSSVWLPAYLAFILPQSIAIFTVFINTDSASKYYIAFTFLIFIAVMITTSININRRYKKEIELTHNNKELIKDLNSEIEIRENVQLQLEKNKEDLENKVKVRTKELRDININLEKVIEKKEQAETSLQYLAYHDKLTGLPNKNLLVDRINQSIKISSRDGQKMAILFLDLDRFKTINDSLGHIVGDKLLQAVASRLHDTLRKHDTVSRNGGDEFVVVLEKLKNHNEAIHIAKKVIDSLTNSFEILSHKIHIGASVGISVYPTDGGTPLTLLRNADTAMYKAKKTGGNQLQFYDASMSNQLRDRLELESELHSALDKNEFYMVYQPQVDSKTGITIGFESLIRWKNNKYGEIGPDRFVPLLEETGLIYSVGEWIVSEVLSFMNTLDATSPVKFSINLSSLQCSSLDFVSFVENEMNKYSTSPTRIEFEVTESLLIHDFDKTELFLDKLHRLGCTIALDDFGTGYTSMNYLARLPIDVVKIDKSLVRNISERKNLRSIVDAIVNMSKSLGLTNIFEGIETEEELSEIQNMGGDIIQGYLFSKPLLSEDIKEWLTKKPLGNASSSGAA
jgi:diguanylate cyclase (GGDEF)-like protein